MRYSRRWSWVLVAVLAWTACANRPGAPSPNGGTSASFLDLDGDWKIQTRPVGEFWDPRVDLDDWGDIRVPGEAMMQGFAIKHDEPFVLRKDFLVPQEFAGRSIELGFDGVYSYARVWVNGRYIRDHSGGFTGWTCDITEAVRPGSAAVLVVEVTDRADEISYASGYAKHPIGGILRDVRLSALPVRRPEDIRLTTDFDEDYRNATLTVRGRLVGAGGEAEIRLELRDRQMRKIRLARDSLRVRGDSFELESMVERPEKWDAEHPVLYRLKVSLVEAGRASWSKEYRFGFREVEVKGRRLLVNGQPVKLRGACRHDIHPLLGRVSTADYEQRDVRLAKEANINFIRTSHYPPTDRFLELCDEYGLYVECETAVCFVGSHRTAAYAPGASESAPEFTERYLSQLREMVGERRNHPSVILWSIGNENAFGTNFKASYDWIKADDPTRPVIFSYPGHVPEGIQAYDILSMHYPGIDGTMQQYAGSTRSFETAGMPVLFDEWAHVACYNAFTVKEDPNVRDFWGRSLDRMWQGAFAAEGCLGGAIWGLVDETFMLPIGLPGFGDWWGRGDASILPGPYAGHTVGYGEWGIIDTWRRKKPEFWNVKKAYSPVRLLEDQSARFEPGRGLAVSVANRFDHTNLAELKVVWSFKGTRRSFSGPDVPPHGQGRLTIPVSSWGPHDSVTVEFRDGQDGLVDVYALHSPPDLKSARAERTPGGRPALSEGQDAVTVTCPSGLEVRIDKRTGRISRIETRTGSLGLDGPFLLLRALGADGKVSSTGIRDYAGDWRMTSFSSDATGPDVMINVKGQSGAMDDVSFSIRVAPDGDIEVSYAVGKTPQGFLREAGVRFLVDAVFESLNWTRVPDWSVYPPEHLSAAEGDVLLSPDILKTYRRDPAKAWESDTKSFFYDGVSDEAPGGLSFAAKATKESVLTYELIRPDQSRLTIIGNGRQGCRLARNGRRLEIIVADALDYPDLGWGNYQRDIRSGGPFSGSVRMLFGRAGS